MSKQHFIYVGDCGADIIDGKLSPGGCALNVTYHLRQLQEKADVLTWIGTDAGGNLTREYLNHLQVNPTGVHVLPGTTAGQFIEVASSGEKNFVGYFEGVLADAKLTRSDQAFLKNSDVLITLYYTQIEHLFHQVTSIDFDGLKVIDFMNGADFSFDITFVEKYSKWFDISFFGLSLKDEVFIHELKKLAILSKKIIVVTLGEKGSFVFWEGKEFFQPALPIPKIIDTTGAGDAYLAGFLSIFKKNNDVLAAMLAGAQQALRALSVKGAIPLLKINTTP